MSASATKSSALISLIQLGVLLLVCSFLMAACSSKKEETPAFTLEGSFEDVFAGKHQNAGSFTVKACGSNALVDVTFENGYRALAGTDGRDSFTYSPVAGDKTTNTNGNGIGAISSGRFPTNAHFFQQILWLLCVQDGEFLTNLQTMRFHFYGDYSAKEIVPQIKTAGTVPDLVTNIRWYAPGQMASGTNRYDLTMYPKGWLVAELAVTKTQLDGKWTLPSQIVFTHYHTRAITNIQQISELRPRDPTDVLPVEVAVFSITNAQASEALSSYVPDILDERTRVHDHRVGKVIQARKGKPWGERDILAQHDWTFQMGDSEYGLIGRDALTLPGGTPVRAYTRLYFGRHKLQIPIPLSWVTGICLGFLITTVFLFAISWRRKKER